MAVGLELGSNEAIKEAVLKGMGITMLPDLAVQSDVSGGRLPALQISGLSRGFFVVLDCRRALPPPARAFLQFVERAVRAGGP